MLDSPIRIFRCPICIEYHIKAPLQDLSLLVEHLAKHFQFHLFECQQCNDRFATPFLANFHIKQGRCKQKNSRTRADDKQPLSFVNLNDVDFSSFCYIQNAVTKSIKDMLAEQTKRIQHLLGKEREPGRKEIRESRRPVTPPRFGESPASPERGPPKKRSRLLEDSARNGGTEVDELETYDSIIPKRCPSQRPILADNLREIFGVEPPRRDIRTSLYSSHQNYRRSREIRTFQDSTDNSQRDIPKTLQKSSFSFFEKRVFVTTEDRVVFNAKHERCFITKAEDYSTIYVTANQRDSPCKSSEGFGRTTVTNKRPRNHGSSPYFRRDCETRREYRRGRLLGYERIVHSDNDDYYEEKLPRHRRVVQ